MHRHRAQLSTASATTAVAFVDDGNGGEERGEAKVFTDDVEFFDWFAPLSRAVTRTRAVL